MKKIRTEKQNRSVHLWFRMIADELNSVGYEQKVTFGSIDTPWSEESVKALFKKIGRYQFDKGKTSEMTTEELSKVADTLHRYISEKGMNVPFPNIVHLLQNKDKQ